MLRERFDVDVAEGWNADELAERIGDYDGILIRSATQADRRPDRPRRPA